MVKKCNTVLGIAEEVTIITKDKKYKTTARIDTGATRSSIDEGLANELKMGPIIETTFVKSAHGSKVRPVIKAKIEIAGQEINAKFTLTDRRHMKYSMLIGRNILKNGFIIDPNK